MVNPAASLEIRAASAKPTAVQIGFDQAGNLVVMDEDGSCWAYDDRTGAPLDACGLPATFQASRNDRPAHPPGIALSTAWPVGDGRWFGWANEHEGGGRDGSAWLYEPGQSRWLELPRAHHHQVWFAASLPGGGFASLGIKANSGALVVWAAPTEPEIITIPCEPGDQNAGLLALTADSLLVWPFRNDGSAVYLKRSGTHGNLWEIAVLPDTAGTVGAIAMPSADAVTRLVSWTRTGAVRMWMPERLAPSARHKSSRLGMPLHAPHHLNRP